MSLISKKSGQASAIHPDVYSPSPLILRIQNIYRGKGQTKVWGRAEGLWWIKSKWLLLSPPQNFAILCRHQAMLGGVRSFEENELHLNIGFEGTHSVIAKIECTRWRIF